MPPCLQIAIRSGEINRARGWWGGHAQTKENTVRPAADPLIQNFERTVFLSDREPDRLLKLPQAPSGRPFGRRTLQDIATKDICGILDRLLAAPSQAKLRVAIDVTETILNHVSGSRSPIQRVYDRYDRLPEMCEALGSYDAHLAAIMA